MVGEKNAFWQALVLTICIFLFGLSIGVMVENSRQNSAERMLINSEVNLDDFQISGGAITRLNLSCEEAKKEIFDFADRIYHDAVQLEEYDSSSKFSDLLKEAHRKYDILRVILLTESVELKERCMMNYTNVIYIYNYKEDDEDMKAQQIVMAKMLEKLKEGNPEKVLLIPMAGNLDLNSVELIMNANNITKVPVIFNDEGNKIYEPLDYKGFERIMLDK